MTNLTDAANNVGPPPLCMGKDSACIEFTSGSSGVAQESLPSGVGPYRSIVILNGVGNTFALTLPNPKIDGQAFIVIFVTAISTAFSCILKGPAKAILGVPSTASANTGIAFYYHEEDLTWYRKY